MTRSHYAFFLSLLPLMVGLSAPARAECPVPHTLSNGQVADASQVMDNFNAVAKCADDAEEKSVKQTGTPQVGNVAVFSGDKAVTGGNLTGDVTTSGGTETTLSDSGVTPGTYINPNVTIDSKGRITAAASGSGSGGGGGGTKIISARVYMNGTQALSASTYTTVQFDTVDFSGIPNLWSGSPNYAFTIPAGVNRAEIVASAGVSSARHSGYFDGTIRKNGTLLAIDGKTSDWYGTLIVHSGVVKVAAGDLITLNVRSRFNKTIGGVRTFMSIKLWSE